MPIENSSVVKDLFWPNLFLEMQLWKNQAILRGRSAGTPGQRQKDNDMMSYLAYDLSDTSSEDKEDKGQDDGGGQQGH